MINWPLTIISEYANSPTIVRLIENINDWIDPSADVDAFYRMIWDLRTAEGYGLDVWGRIVGINRVLSLQVTPPSIGFNEDGLKDYAPFGQQPFFLHKVNDNYVLTDEAYRSLIFLKAAANISNCSAESLNSLITRLFSGRGRCYIIDYLNMTMSYNFTFYLQPFEAALLKQSGILPRPTGVKLFVLQNPVGSTFGFSEMGDGITPFGQGAFLSDLYAFAAAT